MYLYTQTTYAKFGSNGYTCKGLDIMQKHYYNIMQMHYESWKTQPESPFSILGRVVSH